MNCEVCEKPFGFRWTDSHGVGVCTTCGTPYTIYHYDENEKRVEKPPEIALKPSGVDLAKRYWTEHKRRVFPGAFDMGILRSRGNRTYSGATDDDMDAWDRWYANEVPQAKAV